MENMQMNCKEHNSAFSIYCMTCQQMICLLCIGDHSKKSHELMSIVEYCKNIINPQICEQLAVLQARQEKIQKENEEFKNPIFNIDGCATIIEQLIKGKNEEIKILSEMLNFVKQIKYSGFGNAIENSEKIFKHLVNEIAKFGSEKDVSAAMKVESDYKRALDLIKKFDESKISEKFPVIKKNLDIQIDETIKSKDFFIKITNEISTFHSSFCSMNFSLDNGLIAKFIDPNAEKLWSFEENGKICKKQKDDYYCSICAVDQIMYDGNYSIKYLIENLSENNPHDSIGICTSEEFTNCAFSTDIMFGLCRDYSNETTIFDYNLSQGDTIIINYSAINRTIEFFVKDKKIGNTILNVPHKEYYTGVAFRSTGTRIRLIYFIKY